MNIPRRYTDRAKKRGYNVARCAEEYARQYRQAAYLAWQMGFDTLYLNDQDTVVGRYPDRQPFAVHTLAASDDPMNLWAMVHQRLDFLNRYGRLPAG